MKQDTKDTPGSRLRRARDERGWSQPDIAKKLGTTVVNISRWENDATFPGPYFRQKLAEVYGKTLAELGLVSSAANDFRIENIPITRNPLFTGRAPLLDLLHTRLSTTRTAALTQPQALYGLGGIGKTQTAAEYAFRYANDYSHVFWIRAASRETLVADFVELATKLKLAEKDEQDQQQLVAAVRDWLAANEGWLLVMDNADDLLLAQSFLPTNHKGYVLFTTRSQAAGPIAASIEVEKLNLHDGTLLLLRWSKRMGLDAPLEASSEEEREAAEGIVTEMDGLPLALVQAGAYMEETGCCPTDYLSLYAAHRKELLARRSRLILDYPDTVATTWSLSFQQIEQQSVTAADVLRFCTFLAPDAIPEELLLHGIAAPDVADQYTLNKALEVLRQYSLVRRNGDTNTVSIHRLVQAVLRDNMDEETQRAWAERTVRAVNAAFPEANYSANTRHQDYLPHVQECAALIAQYHLHNPEAARLLYQAGAYLYFHGFYPQAQSLLQQALTIREEIYGPAHPAIADNLNILAMLARLQGDDEQAEQFHRQALAIREQSLGPQHPDTAISLNNLGVLYRNLGQYEQAEPLLQQALSIREQLFGPKHLNTLTTFINLAKLYLEQQKYEQAEQMLQQALVAFEQAPESERPLIAQNLNLLAKLYFEQRNYEQAETLWKRSLAILKKTLGQEHPATAERLNDLAELYAAQGHYTQAQSFCQRALSICENILGSEHPDTIAYRQHLSEIMHKIEGEQIDNHHSVPPSHRAG